MLEEIRNWLNSFFQNIWLAIPMFILGLFVAYLVSDKFVLTSKNATIEQLKEALELERMKVKVQVDSNKVLPSTQGQKNIEESNEPVTPCLLSLDAVFNTNGDYQFPIIEFVKLVKSSYDEKAVSFEKDENVFFFQHWAYLWTSDQIIDFGKTEAYKIHFSVKSKPIHPAYFERHTPELHLFICTGKRIVNDGPNLKLLKENVHIGLPINELKFDISMHTEDGFDSKLKGSDIIQPEKWHTVSINLRPNYVQVDIDERTVAYRDKINLPLKAFLRLETWNSTANFWIKNFTIAKR